MPDMVKRQKKAKTKTKTKTRTKTKQTLSLLFKDRRLPAEESLLSPKHNYSRDNK